MKFFIKLLQRQPIVCLSAGLALLCLLLAPWAWLQLAALGLLLLLLYQSLARQQAAHDSLHLMVAERTAELIDLAQHLQWAREDERQRLARDLHDELGALLTSAKLDAARIRSRLGGSAPEASERLAHLVQSLDEVIALTRRIVEDLLPSALGNLGLPATLEILAQEFAARSNVTVHCSVAPVRLSPRAELAVYRLVQEAINNISKYAAARQVWITLASQGTQAQVSVRDDGRGFDSAHPGGTSRGLLGMRYRVEAEQGRLHIRSAPGQGTLIELSLPQLAEAAASP